MKNIDKMSRTVGYLEKLYRKLNERFFENTLSMPIITVQSTPRAYGHLSINHIWEQGEEANFELNIGAETLKRPIDEICATLIHEMTHQYNITHGVQDTSRNYTYHNEKFKTEAEKHGIIIEKIPVYGWTKTIPSDELIQFCIDEQLDEILIQRKETYSLIKPKGGAKDKDNGEKTKGKAKTSTRKYQCPSCGNSFRATKDINVLCMDCMTPFIKV